MTVTSWRAGEEKDVKAWEAKGKTDQLFHSVGDEQRFVEFKERWRSSGEFYCHEGTSGNNCHTQRRRGYIG